MDETFKAILPNLQEVSAERSGDRYYGTHHVSPEVAFQHGIPLKGTDRRLLEHVEAHMYSKSNEKSAFRGTTALPVINPDMGQGAIFWAQEGGWVYLIGPMMGWDPGRLLEGRVSVMGKFGNAPFSMEGEISVPSRIEPSRIIKAAIVKEKGDRLVLDAWKYNPNYPAPK